MTYATEDSAGRLTADAVHLAISLDSLTTMDWVERIGPVVQCATHTLADLQRRYASLATRRADGALIDWILDTIDARLTFLQHLSRRCGDASPPQQREQNHRAPVHVFGAWSSGGASN